MSATISAPVRPLARGRGPWFLLLVFLAIAGVAPAVEVAGMTVAVDRPDGWADAEVSHHGRHASGGAVMAPSAYLGLRLLGSDQRTATSGAIALTVLGGALYELDNAHRFGSWVDPMDVLWTGAGGLMALAGTQDGNWTLTPAIGGGATAMVLAMRF